MNSIEMTWEDEDGNRNVQFSINYTVENADVEIANVTPTAISFICPESKSVTRTIGVHTEKGRNMLADQFAKAGQMEKALAKINEAELVVA